MFLNIFHFKSPMPPIMKIVSLKKTTFILADFEVFK
jgi:hypothetical protein